MLDNLVESISNAENTTRRGGYLLTTAVLVFSLFASGILWSLFAKNLEINGDLEFSSMVAPVQMADDTPPPPEVVKEVKQNTTVKQENSIPVVKQNIARIDETQPIPDKISNTPSQTKVRPNGEFIVNPNAEETSGNSTNRRGNQDGTNEQSTGIIAKPREVEKPEVDEPPQIVAKKPEPKPTQKEVVKPTAPIKVSTILNGRALSLPKPPYPAAAKAIRVSGDVSVQVTIDEKGNVISANAVGGHTLLKQVSEQAARGAKFSPTILGDQPVKVTGIIVYKFSAQ
jgi:periplasmic protein TonB